MKVHGKKSSIKKIEVVSRKQVSRGGRKVELNITKKNTKISPVGESIKEIQKIAGKYFKTPEEEAEAEKKLREALRKEGYYRF